MLCILKEFVYPIILSGGSGTRLWPLSRPTMPKQFTKLFDEFSLFQKTVIRVTDKLFNPNNCNRKFIQDSLLKNQLEHLNTKSSGIIIEPKPFDTAPAALAGVEYANKISKNPIMLICAADHWIEDNKYFKNIIKDLVPYIDNEKFLLLVLNQQMHTQATVRIHAKKTNLKCKDIFKVNKFVEKPKLEVAKNLLLMTRIFGTLEFFMGRASSFINAYKKHANQIYNIVKSSYSNSYKDLNFIRLHEAEWNELEKISIDYAIIEKYKETYMKLFDGIWSDIGSYDSLMKHLQNGDKKNVVLGNSTLFDSENTFLNSTDNQILLVGAGLKNITAIATKDAVLCIDQKNSENVREIVQKLVKNKIEQAEKIL